ncbi:hypothetical protein [Microbulbifer discodermiae]|uniref:hypothetical protein n=1 Tax=Microbulbifer sp. 2201CG32-9 TaxID=3232309 RepID=UPI00345B52DD
MEREISNVRLYAMRLVFLLTFVGLAPSAWQEIIVPAETWEPFYGVAIAFWAALALLSIMGFLYPLKMLPLLFLQLTYKLIWILGVGLPLWQQGLLEGAARELAFANGIGVILDILVIPWVYVARQYFYRPIWWFSGQEKHREPAN